MEVLEKNKTYQIGDFILRASDRDTLRITTDRGRMAILPKADNATEVKSTITNKEYGALHTHKNHEH